MDHVECIINDKLVQINKGNHLLGDFSKVIRINPLSFKKSTKVKRVLRMVAMSLDNLENMDVIFELNNLAKKELTLEEYTVSISKVR
ncbi:hypothetical protein [Caudoviricetes sp.]|nr:hypothetical protein [Caudoviricetes sp.]